MMKGSKWLAILAALAVTVAPAWSQFHYSGRNHIVNAGVLLLDSNLWTSSTYSANDTPFVWYNLDSDVGAKPSGWVFENPNPPSVITAGIAARWGLAGSTVGAPVTRSQASYWEVQLSQTTDTELSQYDVLVASIYETFELTPLERERLRRYVDQGGVLWVDTDSTVSFDPVNNLPTPFMLTSGTSSRTLDTLSPLVTLPNSLGLQDVLALEYGGDTGSFAPLTATELASYYADPLAVDSERMSMVATDNGNGIIGACAVGNGWVVLTTRGAARVLNEGIDPNTGLAVANQGYNADAPAVNRQTASVGRFVVNAISLNSNHAQVAQGTRSLNSISDDLGAPLFPGFGFASAGSPTRSPDLFNGLLVTTDDTHIYVYAAAKGGVRNYLQGQLMWKSEALTGPISNPTCIDIPSTSGAEPEYQIMVVDSTGTVQAFNAFQFGGAAVAPTYSCACTATPGPGALSGIPLAPTYEEGVVYVADWLGSTSGSPGRIWAFNPATGTALSGGAFAVSGSFGSFSASPTVGYIPIQDNSGGADKVVYIPGQGNSSPGSSGATIYSIWVGTRGETGTIGAPATTSVTPPQLTGSSLLIETRAGQILSGAVVYDDTSNAQDPLNPRITFVSASGQTFSDAQTAAAITGPITVVEGNINVTVNTALVTNNVRVVVDYTLDWSQCSPAPVRGTLSLPDQGAGIKQIIGSIALGEDGNFFAVMSTGVAPLGTSVLQGGSVYAFCENKGPGRFSLLYRYEAFDAHTNPAVPAKTIPPAFGDNATPLTATLSGQISNLTFTGPPAVRGNIVYVPAVGYKNTSGLTTDWIPVTVLLALNATPPEPVVTVNEAIPDASKISLIQEDLDREPLDKAAPTTISSFAGGSSNVFSVSSNAASSQSTISFNNLMDTEGGQIMNSIASNLPLVIRTQGGQDLTVWPDATPGSVWNPLVWYAVFPGYVATSAPEVSGNTLYLGGSSVLSHILRGNAPGTGEASILGFNTALNVSEDSIPDVADQRSWMYQMNVYETGSGVTPSSNLLWPSSFSSVAGLAARVDQGALTNTADNTVSVGAIAAGGGLLAVQGNAGLASDWLYTFSSGLLTVADSSRVARFTAGGDTSFSIEAGVQSSLAQDVGVAGDFHNLITPVKAYPLGSDTVIVDEGANRLVVEGDDGRELRSIDQLIIDPGYNISGTASAAPGSVNGEPATFSKPEDVALYSGYVLASANPFTSPSTLEYWQHYVVADSGNGRLVDIVDRFAADPTTYDVGAPISVGGVAQLGVLYWHSPANASGKGWNYDSVAVTQDVEPTGAPSPGTYPLIVGGLSGPASSPNGGALATDSFGQAIQGPTNGGSIQLFEVESLGKTVELPAISQVTIAEEVYTPLLGDTGSDPYTTNSSNERVASGYDNVLWNPTDSEVDGHLVAREKRLSGVRSVSVSSPGGALPADGVLATGQTASNLPILMFTDASGAYEIQFRQPIPAAIPVPTPSPLRLMDSDHWAVDWMLPDKATAATVSGTPAYASVPVYSVCEGLNSPFDVNSGTDGSGLPSSVGTPNAVDYLPGDNIGGLNPNYARRLDGNNVLVVNGYQNSSAFSDGTGFTGEVLIVSGTIDHASSTDNTRLGFGMGKANLAFGTTSIRYQLQSGKGASRKIVAPVFADLK